MSVSPRAWPLVAIGATALLIVSNGFWAYETLDHAATDKARDQVHHETCESLKQALAMMPAVTTKDTHDVVRAAQAAAGGDESFQKEGEIVVGWLAFRFGPDGTLARVAPIIEPSECAP